MTEILITILHILVSVTLVMIVLLQTGKGAGIGALFGGGTSQTLFGTAGPGGFLAKLTTAIAATFMITSLMLAYLSGKGGSSLTIMD